ncbi:MAG: hypothetical protein IKF68_05175 [Erysipelotrichaceae bacterium]|nr:hypothetical protein [Erysipelotrichaceae bacterium]
MDNIGISDHLDRKRIERLLKIGLLASMITGTGDFLLGYGTDTVSVDLATRLMASAPSLSDVQLIIGGSLGMFGIFLEGLSCFAIYRLMADASPKYAHIYRSGILGYIWLAPIGCHLNIAVFNLAYKYLLPVSDRAAHVADILFYAFGIPVYVLLLIFWLPMMVVQFKAFAEGMTPYPSCAKWFNVIVGSIPALLLSLVIGLSTAFGAAVGTMFLSFGNAFMFGGLLVTLPDESCFSEYKKKRGIDDERS